MGKFLGIGLDDDLTACDATGLEVRLYGADQGGYSPQYCEGDDYDEDTSHAELFRIYSLETMLIHKHISTKIVHSQGLTAYTSACKQGVCSP